MPACGKMVGQVHTALVPIILFSSWRSAWSQSYAILPSSNSVQSFLNVKEQKTYSPDFQSCLLSSTFLGTNTSNLVLNVGVDKLQIFAPDSCWAPHCFSKNRGKN